MLSSSATVQSIVTLLQLKPEFQRDNLEQDQQPNIWPVVHASLTLQNGSIYNLKKMVSYPPNCACSEHLYFVYAAFTLSSSSSKHTRKRVGHQPNSSMGAGSGNLCPSNMESSICSWNCLHAVGRGRIPHTLDKEGK